MVFAKSAWLVWYRTYYDQNGFCGTVVQSARRGYSLYLPLYCQTNQVGEKRQRCCVSRFR